MGTSRQLDVDIPRCHQYNNTLASTEGQSFIKRVLTKWILSNKDDLAYWQGLDSLCAPFCILYIDNEDLAYTAFSKFISILLPDMFKPKNDKVINRYLGLPKQLLNFFDPVLGFYLHNQDFSPNLFAIPWFLTMFSHVFSLNKIFILWDRLLLKTQTFYTSDIQQCQNTARIFPVYIAVSMLCILSSELKDYDFSQLCQWSSDMQDFDVRKVMEKAEKMFEKSPLSVGNWEDFDEKIMMQPVPFIRMQRLQMEIFSGQASENVFNNNSGTEKSTNRRPTYGNKNLIVVDTRDSARYK